MPIAAATEEQYTAVRLKDLDYSVSEIRVYLRDSDDNVQQVASDTSSYVQGDDVTMHFTAPSADTYDVAVKADVSSAALALLNQDGQAVLDRDRRITEEDTSSQEEPDVEIRYDTVRPCPSLPPIGAHHVRQDAAGHHRRSSHSLLLRPQGQAFRATRVSRT